MIRLLLDQGLPRGTVSSLRALGIDAQHVGDLGMATASDEHILDFARTNALVVVSLDSDFHATLARERATSPSVVRIRVERLKADQLAHILAQVVSLAAVELNAGAVASVTRTRVRVRRLPIGG